MVLTSQLKIYIEHAKRMCHWFSQSIWNVLRRAKHTRLCGFKHQARKLKSSPATPRLLVLTGFLEKCLKTVWIKLLLYSPSSLSQALIPSWRSTWFPPFLSPLTLSTGSPQGCVDSSALLTALPMTAPPPHSSYTIIDFADDPTIVGVKMGQPTKQRSADWSHGPQIATYQSTLEKPSCRH